MRSSPIVIVSGIEKTSETYKKIADILEKNDIKGKFVAFELNLTWYAGRFYRV